MRQQGRRILGDLCALDDYTSKWISVRMHPATFYSRQHDIRKSLEDIEGHYVEIDMGQYVIFRFSENNDLTTFYRYHHEYI